MVMSLSFATAFAIQKTRTGSSAGIQLLLEKISLTHLFIILSCILLTTIVSFQLSKILSRNILKIIESLNYSLINKSIIGIVILINLLITNYLGILVLITATFIGLYTSLSSIKKINLMSALILPSVIYLLI